MAQTTAIFVRSCPDWGTERSVFERMRPIMAVWDDLFRVRYREYRDALQRLSAQSHLRVRGAFVTRHDTAARLADVVLPVDDDDWFAPHAAEQAEPDTAWEPWVFNDRGFQRWDRAFVCYSNNYAVRPSLLPEATRHTAADRLFKAAAFRIRPCRNSLSYQHLGSASVLAPNWPGAPQAPQTAEDLRGLHERYRVIHRTPLQIPPGLEWARRYLEAASELVAAL